MQRHALRSAQAFEKSEALVGLATGFGVAQQGDLARTALADEDIAIGSGQKTARIGQVVGEDRNRETSGACGITPAGRGMTVLLLATAGVACGGGRSDGRSRTCWARARRAWWAP